MSDLASLAYFCPPEETFWTWDENGGVVSWVDGRTMAFREELDRILENLVQRGFPHLDCLLMLIAACRDGWKQDGPERRILTRLGRLLARNDAPRAGIAHLLSIDVARQLAAADLLSCNEAVDDFEDGMHRLTALGLGTLDRVRDLFARSQKGLCRMELLIRHVLEGVPPRRSSVEAANILAVFRQGFSDDGLVENVARTGVRPPSRERFIETLNDLLSVRHRDRIEDHDLDRLARTGLEIAPVPADLEIPSSRRARALITEILEDESLHGPGALARELTAVVHIPRGVEDSDELPSGGFSDLSNRGPLDRLVLSELAHDDTTLAVRVAMNEAVYLRREVPPRGPDRARALLIDTGIRLWGAPRVFAAATALAVVATADSRQDVHAFEARDGGMEEIDLLSRDGFARHLETLETAVHAGEAVRAFATECRRREIGDAVFITQDDVFEDPDFRGVLGEVWSGELYVATVSRDGEYRLRRWTDRGVHVLQEATLDLEKILRPDEERLSAGDDPPGRVEKTGRPLILSMRPMPLRVPCHVQSRRSAYHRHFGIVSVTKDHRFLHWDRETLGPLEVMDSLPRGGLKLFEIADDGWAYALFGRRAGGAFPLVRVHLSERRHERVNLHPTDEETRGVLLRNGGVIWIGEKSTEVFSVADGTRIHSIPTLPRSWRNRGRIFFQHRRYRTVHFDGRTLSLQEADRAGRPDSARQVSTCFERAGFDGVWDVTVDGRARSMTTGEEIRLTEEFSAPLTCTDVSSDGHRLVLRDAPGSRAREPIGWDLEGETSSRLSNPDVFLRPWLARSRENEKIIRKSGRLRSVAVTGERSLLLLRCSGRYYKLVLLRGGIRFLLVAAGSPEGASLDAKTLELVDGDEGHGVRMAVATWPDGSQVFVDGRGLVHLKSSDPAIAEVSLVLKLDDSTAGWASNGQLHGPGEYHDAESTTDAESFYRNIENFLNRLPL